MQESAGIALRAREQIQPTDGPGMAATSIQTQFIGQLL